MKEELKGTPEPVDMPGAMEAIEKEHAAVVQRYDVAVTKVKETIAKGQEPSDDDKRELAAAEAALNAVKAKGVEWLGQMDKVVNEPAEDKEAA